MKRERTIGRVFNMSSEFYRPAYETDACYYGDVMARDDGPGRLHRNGHILELQDVEWRCIHCQHWFDAASDADAFWCGDDWHEAQ